MKNFNNTYYKILCAVKDSGVKYLITQRRELGTVHYFHIPSMVEFSKPELNRLKNIKAGL